MSALPVLEDAKPSRDENGVPRCTEDDCPQYDGKRCQLLGGRPGHFCEPQLDADYQLLSVYADAPPDKPAPVAATDPLTLLVDVLFMLLRDHVTFGELEQALEDAEKTRAAGGPHYVGPGSEHLVEYAHVAAGRILGAK